jgi:hypothetical protein
MIDVRFGDNLELLHDVADGPFGLIYIAPTFNTGRTRTLTALRTEGDPSGDRTGFRAGPIAVRSPPPIATGATCC